MTKNSLMFQRKRPLNKNLLKPLKILDLITKSKIYPRMSLLYNSVGGNETFPTCDFALFKWAFEQFDQERITTHILPCVHDIVSFWLRFNNQDQCKIKKKDTSNVLSLWGHRFGVRCFVNPVFHFVIICDHLLIFFTTSFCIYNSICKLELSCVCKFAINE